MSKHAAPTARWLRCARRHIRSHTPSCPASSRQLRQPISAVTTTVDAVDNVIGDGMCASAGNVCTLRAAIQEANFQPTDDTILLAVPPPSPGVEPRYDLTITGRGEDAAATGDLDINDDVEIIGQSSPLATIDGLDSDRVVDIHDSCSSCVVVLVRSRHRQRLRR